MNLRGLRLRTKIALVVAVGIAAGVVAGLASSLYSIRRLSLDSSDTARTALTDANREHLGVYLRDTARRVDDYFDRAYAEVGFAAQVASAVARRRAEVASISRALPESPYFGLDLAPKVGKNGTRWHSNPPGRPCSLTVWREEYDANDSLNERVLEEIRGSQLLNFVLPAIATTGLKKQWMYMVGPRDGSFTRICPWADFGTPFDDHYPGADARDWWEFYPGLYDTWLTWPRAPGGLAARASQVTMTVPYVDAAGAGEMITLFHPIWREGDELAGGIGMDITLQQLATFIQEVKVGKTGFAFLAQPDGNIVALDRTAESTLGLSAVKQDKAGVSFVQRNLGASTEPAIADLVLPKVPGVVFREVLLDGVPTIVALTSLRPLPMWTGGIGTTDQAWTLGIVVPREELFGALRATTRTITRRGDALVFNQMLVAMFTMVVVLAAVAFLADRITSRLMALERRATQMLPIDVSVQRRDVARDEVASLTAAFDAMVERVESHTATLETQVARRTDDLEAAKSAISALNKRLEAENVRLGAEQVRMSRELEIAATIQQAMLPRPAHDEELEIAGAMEPADEVGGDFYNVLSRGFGQPSWITIGDVSGHGLGAGLLMMTAQSAFAGAYEVDPEVGTDLAFRQVNRLIHGSSVRTLDGARYITCHLLAHRGAGLFDCVGGHLWPLVYRPSTGEVVEHEVAGPWLGVVAELPSVPVTQIALAPGEVLVLYSDGLVEARDPDNNLFDMTRLRAAVASALASVGSLEQATAHILATVREFAPAQDDDRTILLVRRRARNLLGSLP